MKTSAITISLYNSCFLILCFSVFFYSIATIKSEPHRKDEHTTTLGMLILTFGVSLYFFWASIWREFHAARDSSLWMVDHPVIWVSTLLISSGSIVVLKGLSREYWITTLFIGVLSFIINLSLNM